MLNVLAARANRNSVLAACTMGLALGYSVVGVSTFGIFIVPLSQAFGWGRGDISFAFTIMCYTVVVLAPFVGAAMDRFGVRRVLLPALVGFGLIFASLSLMNGDLPLYYAAYFCLAVFGVGTAPLGYARTVVMWFDKNRGLALGIALAGVGIGTILIPPIVQAVMRIGGWQAGYLVIAGLILFLATPIVALFLHEPRAPAAPADQTKPGGASAPAASPWRSRVFWQLLAGFALLGVFTTGTSAHLIPLLQDRGASPAAAAAGLSMLGASLLVGRLITGYLLDRVFAPIIVGACLGLTILGLAMLWLGASGPLAFVAIALLGFGIGAELDFMSYLVSRYFVISAYARLYGLMYGAFTFGSGLRPLLMGYSFQASGNYSFALSILLGLLVATLPLFLTLGRYPVFEGAEASHH